MSSDHLLECLPYPFNELPRLAQDPYSPDLRAVVHTLLEQCGSLAASLHGGLHSAKGLGEAPARFVPAAFLLQEMLQTALAVSDAWQQAAEARPPSRPPKEKATPVPA